MFARILTLLIPLFGLIIGALISAANGISVATYFPNGIAILLGVPLALFITRLQLKESRWLLYGMTGASLAFLLATFLPIASYGIHRWVPIGPFLLNASMITAPILIFAVGGMSKNFGLVVIFGASAIHYLQPDAGQFTAFLVSVFAIAVSSFTIVKIWSFLVQSKFLLLFPIALIFVWKKEDPLMSVENVEMILHIAGEIGMPGYALSLASVLLILFPFYRSAAQTRHYRGFRFSLSVALLAYWVTTFIVTEFGNFPVPIIGAGASPVLGWYISLGLLHSQRTGSSTQTETPSAGF